MCKSNMENSKPKHTKRGLETGRNMNMSRNRREQEAWTDANRGMNRCSISRQRQ